jgi:hypothetical protein
VKVRVLSWAPLQKPAAAGFFMTMDGRYAGNAGAISGDDPWMVGMPETQKQFPAMTMDGRYAGNAGAISGIAPASRIARCNGVGLKKKPA